MTKKLVVSSVSVSFSIFRVQQYTRATVITNNINNQVAPAPSIQIFANQFKSITRVKLRVLVLKVATSDPHLTFL